MPHRAVLCWLCVGGGGGGKRQDDTKSPVVDHCCATYDQKYTDRMHWKCYATLHRTEVYSDTFFCNARLAQRSHLLVHSVTNRGIARVVLRVF